MPPSSKLKTAAKHAQPAGAPDIPTALYRDLYTGMYRINIKSSYCVFLA